MIGTSAALLGSAVIGAGASAVISSNAAKSAANTSQQATDQAIQLQRDALAQQQANTAVIRGAGDTATTALLDRLGLSSKGSTSQSFDAKAYLAANPDVAAAVNDPSSPFTGATAEERATDHYNRYGKDEVAAGKRGAGDQPATTATETEAQRPDLVQTPGYQAPTLTQTPGYQAPDIGSLDVSLDAYQKDPGYDWQQKEAARGTLAGAAATGSLRSGAAAKALQDRAQQIANTDYTNWRNYTTGQYNTDRSNANQNAQFGYNALVNNNQFADSAAIDASQYGYNALTNQNNTTNSYNQQNFNTDRAYNADQQQQGTNNLFTLSGLGVSATNSNNNAIANTATNTSNALFSNAAAQGNSALAAAGQTNNAINTGVNALSYYYGNKNSTTKNTLPGTYSI